MRGNLSMDRKRGRWASTVRERVDYLRARPQLHREWQGEKHDPRRRQIVESLRDAGLISKTTYWKDVNVDALVRLTNATVRAGK